MDLDERITAWLNGKEIKQEEFKFAKNMSAAEFYALTLLFVTQELIKEDRLYRGRHTGLQEEEIEDLKQSLRLYIGPLKNPKLEFVPMGIGPTQNPLEKKVFATPQNKAELKRLQRVCDIILNKLKEEGITLNFS